jgi:hypothetical protein
MDKMPLNLEPRNTDCDLRTSEMPMHLEAWAITGTTDLAVEREFNGQGYVVQRGKHSRPYRPPDFIQELSFNDEGFHHVKSQASRWTPNNRYCSTAPPASPEELEESFPSRILEYSDSHHPGNLSEIPRQDKVFLVENPECLAVERGKRGRGDEEIEIDLQLPRNSDSSTTINSHLKLPVKLSESIQPGVTQTGARTYVPCKANSKAENKSCCSIHV